MLLLCASKALLHLLLLLLLAMFVHRIASGSEGSSSSGSGYGGVSLGVLLVLSRLVALPLGRKGEAQKSR